MRWNVLCGMSALLLVMSTCAGVASAQPGLIPNADVETDVEPDNNPDLWFSGGPVSYVDDNGPSLPGVKSLQLNELTGGNADWRSSTGPAIPGAQYLWSFDYKFLQGATGGFRADLRFFDGGDFEGEDAPFFDASNIGQWQTSTRMSTAPLFDTPGDPDNPFGDNLLDTRFTANHFGAGNGLVLIDNVLVRQIPEPATAAMLAVAGLLALVGVRRRSR